MAVVLGGLLLQSGPVVAWGGALVLGLAVARALTRLGVSRVRAAGLEMLWRGDARKLTTARGTELVLQAELRNRHNAPVSISRSARGRGAGIARTGAPRER